MHVDAARLRGPCQIVVGTPGRLRALVHDGSLRTEHVRVLVRDAASGAAPTRRSRAEPQVLDEADTLLAGGFVDDIAFVYGTLPARKQVRAVCAQGCCTRVRC